jgi:1,4-alpha-glucan branching enzyme
VPRLRRRSEGELALVLHTHMPYVTGFGTWPFGEEWLWEAIATSYLPLLDLLGRTPLTLSLTPVLCDQLEEPGAIGRCLKFLDEIRPESHRRDIAAVRAAGEEQLAAELERSQAEYARAADRLRSLPDGGLLRALGAHASWTSAATHAVLPLLATDSGVSLQVGTGVASHRRRFGDWGGGFWLPECAHAPWLHALIEEGGARFSCVELTARFGLGDDRHLAPMQTDEGPVLWPIDRSIIGLVWSDAGYPSGAAYRDYHRLTDHHHRVWANDGGAYDHARAVAQTREDARDFVARVKRRVGDGGVCVCALDTELLGHWWYEGAWWLDAVIEESARQELTLAALDEDLLERHPAAKPGPEEELSASSWGDGGDLRTWSGPVVADMAWRTRRAELMVAANPGAPSERALRELLALQSSDWAFLVTRELAGEYPRERADAHAVAVEQALREPQSLEATVRNLAPDLVGWDG